MRFMFPDDRDRAKRLPRLFAMLYDSDAVAMRIVSADASAVTLWHPPGATHDDDPPGLIDRLRGLWIFGSALSRGRSLGEAIGSHFPEQPFWYLQIAGCARAAQGRGLGAAVVRAGLDRATGVPTYLETANEVNLGFYRLFGFEVIDRWQVPDGPVFWSMLRPPDSA